MIAKENKVLAPKIDPHILWQMNEVAFNDWREKYDYPRIIAFLKRRLPEFEIWMELQKLSDEILIRYSPATFLKDNSSNIHLYSLPDKEDQEQLSERNSDKKTVRERKDIIPYPVWYRQKTKQRPTQLHINVREGRSHFILSELELLDLGNYHLINMFEIGNRHLDFVSIDDLRISSCLSGTWIKLHFCSAINVTVDGDLAFLDAYSSRFYEIYNQQHRSLKLSNGSFARWSFVNCDINLTATNAILQSWNFIGWDFNGTINNTDIRDCSFKTPKADYLLAYERYRDFHAHIKRLYSQIGKKKEASQHYYLEKTFERKTFFYATVNYRFEYSKIPAKWSRRMVFKSIYFLRYIYSGFQNVLWGYGERPARVFLISLMTILLSALCYCFSPNAAPQTKYHFGNALYYSMVTFTTLGYGDISQPTESLRFLSGFEALLGMTFWGILIAGFTSNAKDY